tara:strand:+ start:12793 stop:13434 length:642 start_codon:yes stop_codon:yes gene_type:complete
MINKVLLFDLGGVIINIDPLITIKNLKKKSNIKSNIFESIDYRFGEKESVIKNLFFDFEKGEINADLFRDKIREHGKINLKNDEFDNIWNMVILDFNIDVLKMILKLKSKFSLMILSNTNSIHRKYFEKMLLNNHGLSFEDIFDNIFYSFDMKCRKPEKEIYQMVISKSGIKASNFIFFDDMKENIDAAKNVGMNGYLVSNISDLIYYLKTIN